MSKAGVQLPGCPSSFLPTLSGILWLSFLTSLVIFTSTVLKIFIIHVTRVSGACLWFMCKGHHEMAARDRFNVRGRALSEGNVD